MNTENTNTEQDSNDVEVLLSSKASLVAVIIVILLVVVSISLIDKNTQGFNVGENDQLSASDHFQEAIRAIHTRHTPDVIMHRNALEQLGAPAEQITMLNAFTQAMADDNQAAAESLQEIKATTDETITTYMYYIAGEMAFRQKDYASAINYLQTAIKVGESLDTKCLPAYQLMASLHFDQGNMQHAIEAAMQVAEINPEDAQIYRFMGMIQQDYEQWEDAKIAYITCLEKDRWADYQEEVLIGLGQICLKLREYGEAKHYLQLVTVTPQVLALRAECDYNLGDPGLALDQLARSLEADPSQRDAVLLTGTIQVQDKQYNEAIATILQGLESHPKDDQLMYKLAEAYRGVGDNENAEKYIAMSDSLRQKRERFSKLNTDAIGEPTNIDMRMELGQLAEEIGKPELAIGWFQAVLQLDPTHEAATQNLNRIFIELSGGTVPKEDAIQVPLKPQTPVLPNSNNTPADAPVLPQTTQPKVPVLPQSTPPNK